MRRMRTNEFKPLVKSLVTADTTDANIVVNGAFKKDEYYIISFDLKLTDSGGVVSKLYYNGQPLKLILAVDSNFKFLTTLPEVTNSTRYVLAVLTD